MTALLPHLVDRTVSHLGTGQASISLGLIAFVTVVFLLVERDTLAGRGLGRPTAALTAVAIPLAVTVFVMLVVRVLVLAH
jgi:hypothetical protein